MARSNNIFTTIRTEGALLPADLLQRISEGASIDGLTPESYHRPGEKLNEVINRSWNALQGAWASFKSAQERLPESDLGTSITRERWLLPLFRELDYGRLQTATAVEIDGRSYPISHGWEHVPVHLVSYKLELEKSTRGVAGAAAMSPHSLLQVFLNRSEGNLWGFLSNGYKLRILRDNLTLTRQAFVEFDLEAMMEGEVYSDFVLLWLLCHQSRVEGERPADCWLEKWMKVAEDQGTRALDQLRDGVEQAITALGLGFLEYPANAGLRDKLSSGELNAQEYYRQLLRMVYRLLFLFVAEDRDLLLNPQADEASRATYVKYYSMQRLRRMAERFKGTRHPDLFEGLRLVMRLLSGESPHPKSFSQGEKDLLRRGTKDAEIYENIASKAMMQISRNLRQRQTPAEEIMWEALRNRRLNDLKFRRQHPIAETQYVVDFMCYESKLVVEIDGGIHNQQPVADAKRQSDIEALGYRVLRFTNDEVYNDLQWILANIVHAANRPSTLGRGAGGEGLGLVPLGSFLFRDIAVSDIIDCQISNQHLLTAVRALSLTYDQRAQVYRTVDYKNLGSDELGSIFESLLELHPQINVPARHFALSTAAGNERKTTGSYYTPESLVHALLDSALNPVLEEAIKPSPQTPLPKGEGLTAEQRILALKVCDPACGSGHFLIAAANRIAKALAMVRTGEEEPTPAAVQEAKRDVISHCIYGVDINPMAVELCKVNLWMEALEPGKPLNFLDHRIQVGNSLLGTTPKLMAGGIPDDAFNPIEGDDPKYASTMKKLNKQERKDRETGQRSMFELIEPPANYGYLTEAMHALDDTPDDTLDAVRRKEAQYAALASDPEYIKARLLADAWCAAFVWEKKQNGLLMPMTDLLYRRMEEDPLAENLQAVREYVVELKERYQFFHWHVAFPDVFTVPEEMQHAQNEQTGWHGGFDCVLGNPPWDMVEISEKEFFARRSQGISEARTAAIRKRMIAELSQTDPVLHAEYLDALRQVNATTHYIRSSNYFPLTAKGRINTYPLFAELNRTVISGNGQAGIIVPSGIASDDNNKYFFERVMESQSLVSLYSFENEEKLFPSVHNQLKFCLLTISGDLRAVNEADFVFFARQTNYLKDTERHFTLSAADVALINPNSRTCATFRSRYDAEITKYIHNNVPILVNEIADQNYWGVGFKQGLFNMASDSSLFVSRNNLEALGGEFRGNYFYDKSSQVYLPLYEAKLIYHFDHRYSTYEGASQAELNSGRLPKTTEIQKSDPNFVPIPNHWVEIDEVRTALDNGWESRWLLGWRDITNSVSERTLISTFIPLTGCGDTFLLMFPDADIQHIAALESLLNSFIVDYVSRQKVSGVHLKYNVFKQLPVIPPHTYTQALLDFIVPRVLELTYTAWDLQAFAKDVGYHGAPFVWDEERRFLMRCELDALYFHLYQIPRDDVDYIMETFPIIKRKDEARHGEYLTKRVILEMYDQMAALPMMAVPAPKDESATYDVPDVSQWVTWLNPPPASPSVAHGG